MTLVHFILIFIVIVNVIFVVKLLKDVIKHRLELSKEPGNTFWLIVSTPIIFFFSAFGISDFAISTILYRKRNWLEDKLLPGTLNTQCVLPVAAMALAFISIIEVDVLTLFTCIIAQIIGAYFGPRFVVRLSANTIRLFMGFGLILATLIIIAGKYHLIPSGGNEIGLRGLKLTTAALFLCLFGALNNIGIGSYAPTMITIYALGMNPIVAFPIMMGACTFSVSIGSMQFIKYGQYSRKITLFAASFGVLGVLIGVYFIKELNVSLLQWVIAGVLLYSGGNMIIQEFKHKLQVRRALC